MKNNEKIKKDMNLKSKEYNFRNSKFILKSLKEIISEKEEIFIISKVSGLKSKNKKEKTYNIEKIEFTDKDNFFYDIKSLKPEEANLECIIKKMKSQFFLFEIGVLVDLFIFLKMHLNDDILSYIETYVKYDDGFNPINKDNIYCMNIDADKLQRKLNNYYYDKDKEIFIPYKIKKDEKDEKPRRLYSLEHLSVIEKILNLEKHRLTIDNIEELLLKTEHSDCSLYDMMIIEFKLKNKIKNIESNVKKYDYCDLSSKIGELSNIYNKKITISQVIEYIFCLYYILKCDNVLFHIKSYDMHFYYFLYHLKYMYIKECITEDNSFLHIIKEKYDEILKIYFDKYNKIKEEQKEVFDNIYSDKDIYRFTNLHHGSYADYLENEKNIKSVLNKGYNYTSLFFEDEKEYYYFASTLILFIEFKLYYDCAKYKEDIIYNSEKNIKYDELYNLISSIKYINLIYKIVQRLNAMSFLSNDNMLLASAELNRHQLYFCYKYLELIKEGKELEYIKDIAEKIENDDFLKDECSFIENSQNQFYDFLDNISYDDLNNIEKINELKNKFISKVKLTKFKVLDLDYDKKHNDELIQQKDREIFFDNNYKLIYKFIKYILYKEKIYINNDERKKEIDKTFDEKFIKITEHLYYLSYYREIFDYDNLNDVYIDSSEYMIYMNKYVLEEEYDNMYNPYNALNELAELGAYDVFEDLIENGILTLE